MFRFALAIAAVSGVALYSMSAAIPSPDTIPASGGNITIQPINHATLEIAIGSSTQIALFVAPLLVFISLAVGHPMDFVFTSFEVAAVGLATLIVARIVVDGRSNWLEGAQLVGAYLIMAVSFFFVRSF